MHKMSKESASAVAGLQARLVSLEDLSARQSEMITFLIDRFDNLKEMRVDVDNKLESLSITIHTEGIDTITNVTNLDKEGTNG